MLIIFDLDGVLIESRYMHFSALNTALIEYGYPPIGWQDHLDKYNGLPTKTKLGMLTVDIQFHDEIEARKQELTRRHIEDLQPDGRLIALFTTLIGLGHRIAVASNSRPETTNMALKNLGLAPYVSLAASPDWGYAKPDPGMYLDCMQWLGYSPDETLIVEDSPVGVQAAEASGAKVVRVSGPEEVTLAAIIGHIATYHPLSFPKKPNIVVPMAGKGKRFEEAGYSFPKPLIEVAGKPMIQRVIESFGVDGYYTFIVNKEHEEKYNISSMLSQIVPECVVKVIDGETQGAADTVLSVADLIDTDVPLLIVNSDQIVEWDADETLRMFSQKDVDGGIVTFESVHPKWSYVGKDENGLVDEVVEKEVISNEATVGIYYWKRGSDFVKCALEMMDYESEKVNGEYYIAPVYNFAIADGLKIVTQGVGRMWGLGDPESLEEYLRCNP